VRTTPPPPLGTHRTYCGSAGLQRPGNR
jgi:hypothetical protein